MMREDVCIVLNERESSKVKAAESLESKFKQKNITVSRLEIGEDLDKILSQRNPRIIVCDYLLGDLTTGLDLMESMKPSKKTSRPNFIFLTDEPSVPVAVQAMRFGAKNYHEIDNPQSINHIVEEAVSILENCSKPSTRSNASVPSLSDFIAQSEASIALVNKCHILIQEHAPIIAVQGPVGSGRSFLAAAIANQRKSNSFLRTVDLDLYDKSIAELTGLSSNNNWTFRLGQNLSLNIDHVEADDGELLDSIDKHGTKIWPNLASEDLKNSQSFLIVASSCAQTIKAWKRLTNCKVITIPSLSQREQDISPLVQRFVREAASLADSKIKAFDADLVLWLSKQEWPGEIKQLRSVIFEAALHSLVTETDLKQEISEMRERWVEDNQAASTFPAIEPLLAARVLESCNHRYRIAAAKLGCSISELKNIISV